METLRSIVVPTDFSPLAEAAAARAADLARRSGAELHLLHALAVPVVLAPYEVAVPLDVWERVRQSLQAKLEQARKGLEAKGASAVTAQLYDAQDAASAIVDAVRAHRADLVVMGTHGYGGLQHAFLGSVAERTLRAVDVPVLAVKGDLASAATPITRMLVAVDFSPHSDRAVADAASLAKRLSASVEVVHAFDMPFDDDDGYLSAFDAELVQKIETRAKAMLAEVAERLGRDGAPARAHFRRGRPHVVIAEVAREIGCQLIAMGTRGRTGLAHVLIGSVAERTLRAAPCSVLCVRA